MKVDLFDFDLPRSLIAEHPASPRDSARLLQVAGLHDFHMRDLPSLLRSDDVMVFNDTRVIPARLTGHRGEARVEITLHERTGEDRWLSFVKGAKKLKVGQTIAFAPGFMAEVLSKNDSGEVGLLFNRRGADLMAALERHGRMPLPPYIKRSPDDNEDAADRVSYQTAYARHDGAVAAPTAGLHFTEELLAALTAKGILREMVTLHVGAGTFLPVKVDNTEDHKMHREWGRIDEPTCQRLNAAREQGRRIVAVGTTSLRLLESAVQPDGTFAPFETTTDIFITPGHVFRSADLLLTNFHLPRSTLFMLVCAFAGMETMQAAYEHAKAGGYRFYSYGDGCLLQRTEHT